MLETLVLYAFCYFFVKMKTKNASIVRATIAGAICIFLLIGTISLFASTTPAVGIALLIPCILFGLRVIFDIKNIIENEYEDTNRKPKADNLEERRDKVSFCSKCSFQIFPEDKRCPNCGLEVSASIDD